MGPHKLYNHGVIDSGRCKVLIEKNYHPSGISGIDEKPGSSVRDTQPNHNRPPAGETNNPRPSQPSNEFIDRCLKDEEFTDKLKPEHIKLSSAMAMSAAAVSPFLGKNEDVERQFTHFFSVFGIEMATDMVYNMVGERGNSMKDIFGQVRL